MDHVVSKEFKTVDRKFAIGDPVSESDIHPEGLLSFEDWKKRGFIVGAKPAPTPLSSQSFATTSDEPHE
jgi:hypothetical protein